MDLNKIIIEIKKFIDTKDNITFKSLLSINQEIYEVLKEKDNNISNNLIFDILIKFYDLKLTKTSITDYTYFRNYDYLSKIKIPKEYKLLEQQFNKLLKIPQPEQRTPEWFAYRKERITASDCAAAIDLNPYEPVEEFIKKKCDPNHKFLDNENVYHGKKYEPIATLLYEHIYNTRVTEFGALPSDKYPILGASPDGICSKYTLDNKFSNLLGRMLEIKCTVGRKIYTSGKIVGHICPFYYYCQVQQQLESCDLELCDFWQCKIVEYKNREEYLSDLCDDTTHTVGDNSTKITINDIIKKGIILKFLPKEFIPEFDKDNIHWKSKFIYPPKLNMTEIEYDNWVLNTLNDCNELQKTHYFDKIIYWKLEESHNVTINRDKIFFSKILPILYDTWNRVLYYRNNLDKLEELDNIIIKRNKRISFDSTIKISNNILKQKIKFLYNKNLKNLNNKEIDFID